MDKSTVLSLLKSKGIDAKYSLGQNFLIDDNILKKIVYSSNINNNDLVIEIGPGLGSLTEHLIGAAKHVLAYEIDQDMIDILNMRFCDVSNLTIINKDVLKANITSDIKNLNISYGKILIVANLPYYITTPILIKLLEEMDNIDIVVMVQKEMAERFSAKAKTKDYNSLSVLIQYKHEVKALFDVSPSCFYPAPNVYSTVIEIKYYDHNYQVLDEDFFFEFNRNIFKLRRKTLYNNLKTSYNYDKETVEKVLSSYGLSNTVRSEELSVKDIVNLSNSFYSLKDEYLIKAKAKVNLMLRVVGKKDNYHLLDMINIKIGLADIIKIKKGEEFKISFTSNNDNFKVDKNSDLLLKVINDFFNKYQISDKYELIIEKKIPVGAGLGGASCDIASVIRFFNQLYDLKLNDEELIDFVKDYGADIPYCLFDRIKRVYGIGEVVDDIEISYPTNFMVVYPNCKVETKEVFKYAQINNSYQYNGLELVNELEDACFKAYPILKEYKEYLLSKGFDLVNLSGSGSSFICYGNNLDSLKTSIENEKGWFIYIYNKDGE